MPKGVAPDTFGPRIKSVIAGLSGFYKNSKREVARLCGQKIMEGRKKSGSLTK